MNKRLIGMIAAGGAAAAALAVTAGPAQAASQPPQCRADAGAACLNVTNGTKGQVHSISVNGRCVSFPTDSANLYFPEVSVASSGASPTTLTYSGYRCESTTQNSQPVSWYSGTWDNNYRSVVIGRIWQ
ncbi:hypothetical protein ABZ250_13895 [Streptomyces afghaniensis]|uniref:hypothetical protein n=1 Tax=Streptomyces afghaniensis TaxID=66865 RepID=UPI00339F77C6